MVRRVRAACLRRTRSGTVRTARHAFDARRVISPIFSAPAAMRAWVSTHRMVGNAWTVLLERSHRVCPAPQAARAAATSAPCTSRIQGESVVHALLGSSRTRNDTSVWTVALGSTATAACVKRVLLGLSRRTTRVAAICAWHSGRTSTVPTEWLAQDVAQATSLSPIAQGVRRALPWVTHTCLRQVILAYSAMWGVSRMLR